MNVPPICELKDGSHLHRFFFGVGVAHVSELHQVLLRKALGQLKVLLNVRSCRDGGDWD